MVNIRALQMFPESLPRPELVRCRGESLSPTANTCEPYDTDCDEYTVGNE